MTDRTLQPALRAVIVMVMAALAFLAVPSLAQSFPKLTGRVVDNAHLLSPEQVAQLDAKLAALETQSQRQLVVATIPDLQGYEIEDYGYQLGRAWGIGDKGRNDGAVLIVAPNERKVRIEVGYGLEGILTDALTSLIIQREVIPRFKANDYPGGIIAATDQIIAQLQLPADQARAVAAQAASAQQADNEPGFDFGFWLWLVIFVLFFVLPFIRRMRGGKSYGPGGVMIFPTGGWGGGSSGGSFGGGGGFGGGFSGGGGSFGGGGSSGSW